MSYNLGDVVEALVREYLVRAGCNGTLEAFNREKPKHANSITKREVLRKILGLDNATVYFKKQNPAAESIPSTLEVWANYQMAKLGSRTETPSGPQQASRLVSRPSEEPEEASVPVAAPVAPGRRPTSVTRSPAAATAALASAGAVRSLSWRRKGADGLRKKSFRSKKGLMQAAASAGAAAAAAAGQGKEPAGPAHAQAHARRAVRLSALPRAAPPPHASAAAAAAAAAAAVAAAAARRPAAPSLPPLHAQKPQPPPPPAALTPPARNQRQSHSHPHHPTTASAAGSVMSSIPAVNHARSPTPPGIAHKPIGPGTAATTASAALPAVAATPVVPVAAAPPRAAGPAGAAHVSATPAMPPVSTRSPTPPKSLTALTAPPVVANPPSLSTHPPISPTTALLKVPATIPSTTTTTASAATSAMAPPPQPLAIAKAGMAGVHTAAHSAAAAPCAPTAAAPTGLTIVPTATCAASHGTSATASTATRLPPDAERLATTHPAEGPTGLAGRPAPARPGFGFADSPAASTTPSRAPAAAMPPGGRRASGPSCVDDDEPEIIHQPASLSRGSVGAGVGGRPGAVGAGMPHSASASNVALRTPVPGFGSGPAATAPMNRAGSAAAVAGGTATVPRAPAPAAQRPGAAAAAPRRPGSGPGARHGGDLVMEDVGDMSFEDEDLGVGSMRISGPTARKPGNPIPPDALKQLRQLLWGGQGQPPPSWKQGFFFNRHPGLQFGLLQKQGGPCGVLAAVQAHILAALHSPSTGFNLSPRAPDQQSALTAALAESLWQARMGPVAVLVLPEGEAGGAAGRLGYDQLSRAVASHSANSKEALVDLIRGALSVLMSEDGWGVVLFVMSLALSRGVASIQGDMDEPNNSLLGMHGYCTQELVNLILLGAATSNVFDGNKQLDGSTTLKGISRRCRLGLLTLFEWYKYVEVGPSLKNPTLPVWVVCSESHFTVLFAQDSRALQNQLPFDLFYYDELANQETLIKLSVSRDPKGGWTARMGSTIGDRGKCEGQNIPPLECVIETRWPGVKVSWNGHDPIL